VRIYLLSTTEFNLRSRCLNGQLLSGTLAPSKRQLAEEFEVSSTVVAQVMRELIDEQLFYTVPRSGTFVGMPRPTRREGFVFYSEDLPQYTTTQLVRTGFESRIAQLGGAVFTLYADQIKEYVEEDAMPLVAGAMEWGYRIPADLRRHIRNADSNLVCYATTTEEADGRDSVAFDDIDGGRQAAEHLIVQGHRRIAFLGLHQKELRTSCSNEEPEWSRLREQGWRLALQNSGLWSENLAFYATRPVDGRSPEDQEQAAHETARRLLAHADIDAVVVTNDHATRALLNELRKGGILDLNLRLALTTQLINKFSLLRISSNLKRNKLRL
jgi:DNA-binding LacI/PurR family transcriptional regulator